MRIDCKLVAYIKEKHLPKSDYFETELYSLHHYDDANHYEIKFEMIIFEVISNFILNKKEFISAPGFIQHLSFCQIQYAYICDLKLLVCLNTGLDI